jgi:hypothetical protein
MDLHGKQSRIYRLLAHYLTAVQAKCYTCYATVTSYFCMSARQQFASVILHTQVKPLSAMLLYFFIPGDKSSRVSQVLGLAGLAVPKTEKSLDGFPCAFYSDA